MITETSYEINLTTDYIYALVDPRDAKVRYVGQTNRPQARLKQHLSIKRKYPQDNPKDEWIQELLDDGNRFPKMFILCERPSSLSRSLRYWQEQHWIAYFRENGHKLTNNTKNLYTLSHCMEKLEQCEAEHHERAEYLANYVAQRGKELGNSPV